MTSGRPLLSSLDNSPLSGQSLPHHSRSFGSFGSSRPDGSFNISMLHLAHCEPFEVDCSKNENDEDEAQFTGDTSFNSVNPVGESFDSVVTTKRLPSVDSEPFEHASLECSSQRRNRLISWGATAMEMLRNDNSTPFSTSFDISGDSGNLDKSKRRTCRKSVQFDDDVLREEDARFIYINNPRRTNDKYEFTGNEIRTSKYSLVTFLPKNRFIQFHRVAYLYFLAIAALNQLPPLAVFGRAVSLFPLLFVLCVTAIKDGYEDWRRHRSDRNENNREALVLQCGQFKSRKWKKIQAGEVVKICADETIPCDMVLLGTSDPSGVAYIQTMNLDGESNLKTRYARQETSLAVLEGCAISGLIRCEQPNRNIYEFAANMEFNGQKFSLSQSNIVLRGCQLKNTGWIIGVVVYAGQETKAMLNSAASPSKRSKLESYMNWETLVIYFSVHNVCGCCCRDGSMACTLQSPA